MCFPVFVCCIVSPDPETVVLSKCHLTAVHVPPGTICSVAFTADAAASSPSAAMLHEKRIVLESIQMEQNVRQVMTANLASI